MDPKPAECTEWLDTHQQGRKPSHVRWIQSVSQVNIMLRVSTLDVWTPRCSNPRLQEWVNDLTSSLGKNMTLFGLEKVPTNLHPQHIHRLTCHVIVPWSRRITGRVKKAWPQISFTCPPSRSNEPLPSSGICIVKRLRLLKPYLTYCLAAAPGYFPLQKKPTRCYVKRQWRVCLACDPMNMQFFSCSESKRHALFPMQSLVVSLSGHIGMTWTPQSRDGMKDIWAQTHSASNRREKCWEVVSVIIMWSVSDSYRTGCALCS